MLAELPDGITCDEPAAGSNCPTSMSDIEQLPESDVSVTSLVPGCYLRADGTSAAHVQTLAEAAGTSKLPPILVQKVGSRIIDGMHRLAAARLRGDKSINARVIDCTDEEALVLAVKSNTLHGLPLSRADRIAGAKRILAAHPDWSDRAVAGAAGLSGKTVAVLRNRSTDEAHGPAKRLGRDGKRRPVAAAEGRKRAVAYIMTHPDSSLREVAKQTDVSLGTVHDVRERLRRGVDPTARRRPSADASPVRPAASSGEQPAGRCGQPPAWPVISPKLAGDPTLKYTEGGRAFLRWMALHAMHSEQWVEFLDAIPEHWLSEVSAVADTISGQWQMFAEQLRKRDESAQPGCAQAG